MLANNTYTDSLSRLSQEHDTSVSESWFSDTDVAVLASESARTGFQGALDWYRVATAPPGPLTSDQLLMSGRKLDVPTTFLGGALDWCLYFLSGGFESYDAISSDFRGATILNGSGHWPYLEQLRETLEFMTGFWHLCDERHDCAGAESWVTMP